MGRKCFRVLIFKSVYWVLSWRVSRCFKINSFLLFPVQNTNTFVYLHLFFPLWRWPWSGPSTSRAGALYHHLPAPRWRTSSQRAPPYSGNWAYRPPPPPRSSSLSVFFFNWRDYPLVARRLFIYQSDCKVGKILIVILIWNSRLTYICADVRLVSTSQNKLKFTAGF